MSAALDNFASAATERFRKVRVPRRIDKRFSVAFAGFRRSPLGVIERVSAIVSNFEGDNGPSAADTWDEFRVFAKTTTNQRASAIVVLGSGAQVLTRADASEFGEVMFARDLPPTATTSMMRDLARRAHERDKSDTVGSSVSSVVVFPDAQPTTTLTRRPLTPSSPLRRSLSLAAGERS
jgi:hypothetical protein